MYLRTYEWKNPGRTVRLRELGGCWAVISPFHSAFIVFEKMLTWNPRAPSPLLTKQSRDAPALLAVQQRVVGGHVPLQLAFVRQQVLPGLQLLLGLRAHLPELRLQPADHRAQVLQLDVVPVFGVVQRVLQASFLQERERGPSSRPTGGPWEEGGGQSRGRGWLRPGLSLSPRAITLTDWGGSVGEVLNPPGEARDLFSLIH